MYILEWAIVTPIPGEPRPPPRSSGTGWGRGELFKIFGDGVGTGEGKVLGFSGDKTPKITDFRGGDGGHNIGDFAHSIFYHGLLSFSRLFIYIMVFVLQVTFFKNGTKSLPKF